MSSHKQLLQRKGTNCNIQQLILPQKHGHVPSKANIEPKVLQPRDNSLWPWNKPLSQHCLPEDKEIYKDLDCKKHSSGKKS